jgi:O-antigen/teichoic acid export membrane protein
MTHHHEYKLFAQRIGLMGITNLIVSLSGVILVAFLTKTLPIEEYGIWAQTMVTIVLLPQVVNLGLPYATIRFLAGINKREDIQECFYSNAFIVLITGAGASSLLLMLREPISTLLFNSNTSVFEILSLIVLIECLNNLMLSYFRAFQQIRKYTLFTFLQTCLNLFLVAYFVLSGYGIIGAVAGVLITRCSIFLITISIIVSNIGFKIPRLKNIRDYLAFGLPTVQGNFSSWVVTSSDRYVIGMLLGTAYVGYYSPGFALGNIIQMYTLTIGLLLPAALSKYYDKNDLNTVKTILKYSLKYFLLLAIPSATGLSLLSKPMLVMLSTQDIASNGYLVTPFIAIGAIFLGAFGIISHIIVLEKKMAIIGNMYMIAAILTFLLNMILVPNMGITGAAFTEALVSILIFTIGTYYSFSYMKFPIDFQFIIKSIFSSIIMSPVILVWDPEGLPSVMAAIGVCAVVYAVVLFVFRGISREEIAFFRGIFHA